MPVQQTYECDYCGKTNDKQNERCKKCGKYKDEDADEYQKHLDKIENQNEESID